MSTIQDSLHLKQRLTALGVDGGMTVKKYSQLVGIDYSTMSRYLRKKAEPSLKVLEKMKSVMEELEENK